MRKIRELTVLENRQPMLTEPLSSMTNYKINTRITNAWQQAWRMRCCPPDTVLAGEMTGELEQHLEICPACRRARADSLPEIKLNFPSESSAQKRVPQVGELWSITKKTAGWGPKYRYYSPPVVLITAMVDDKAVNVIQIFGDPTLAGPDDILLDNNSIGLVEVWNRYTLKSDILENCLGKVSTDLVHRIEKTPEQHHPAPSPGSLLWFFRQMEVETGWFFAEQSLADLLESEEVASSLALCYKNAESLLEDLQELPVILPDACLNGLPGNILANAMPADDLLPMAAAEEEPEKIQILIFTVQQGRIQDVKMVPGLVTLHNEQDSLLQISGLCKDCPDQNCEWIFRWQSGKLSIEPLPGQYGAENGIFWAVFPTNEMPETVEGELIVRIIAHQ